MFMDIQYSGPASMQSNPIFVDLNPGVKSETTCIIRSGDLDKNMSHKI